MSNLQPTKWRLREDCGGTYRQTYPFILAVKSFPFSHEPNYCFMVRDRFVCGKPRGDDYE